MNLFAELIQHPGNGFDADAEKKADLAANLRDGLKQWIFKTRMISNKMKEGWYEGVDRCMHGGLLTTPKLDKNGEIIKDENTPNRYDWYEPNEQLIKLREAIAAIAKMGVDLSEEELVRLAKVRREFFADLEAMKQRDAQVTEEAMTYIEKVGGTRKDDIDGCNDPKVVQRARQLTT